MLYQTYNDSPLIFRRVPILRDKSAKPSNDPSSSHSRHRIEMTRLHYFETSPPRARDKIKENERKWPGTVPPVHKAARQIITSMAIKVRRKTIESTFNLFLKVKRQTGGRKKCHPPISDGIWNEVVHLHQKISRWAVELGPMNAIWGPLN